MTVEAMAVSLDQLTVTGTAVAAVAVGVFTATATVLTAAASGGSNLAAISAIVDNAVIAQGMTQGGVPFGANWAAATVVA